MEYPVETFTQEEQARLRPYFTNLDRPVFALVNLPETVKGALFARYSRYPGTLRRLFLDEFADDLPPHPAGTGGEAREDRAARLYETIFLGYGDDSVAQLGGAHVACEWVSNVLTKVLQRPRLGAYLEQSTRYIAYDQPLPDGRGYRYYRDPELGPDYATAMDELFTIYARLLPAVAAWAAEQFPREPGEAPAAHARAIRAKALDLVRGLLPASSLSHMGIFATGQTYEQLILHLLAHPLPEARDYGEMILAELQAVMPSFVTRIPRPDRGGQWVGYLRERAAAGERWARRLGLESGGDGGEDGPSVELLSVRGEEDDLLAALLFEHAGDVGAERARGGERTRRRRARGAPGRARWRATQPPSPSRARLRISELPIRDRLRLRRLPRPAAPPHAHRPVAAAHPRAGRRRPRPDRAGRRRGRVPAGARALAGRLRAAWWRAGWRAPPPTRSASATASATCSISTPARPCS